MRLIDRRFKIGFAVTLVVMAIGVWLGARYTGIIAPASSAPGSSPGANSRCFHTRYG